MYVVYPESKWVYSEAVQSPVLTFMYRQGSAGMSTIGKAQRHIEAPRGTLAILRKAVKHECDLCGGISTRVENDGVAAIGLSGEM